MNTVLPVSSLTFEQYVYIQLCTIFKKYTNNTILTPSIKHIINTILKEFIILKKKENEEYCYTHITNTNTTTTTIITKEYRYQLARKILYNMKHGEVSYIIENLISGIWNPITFIYMSHDELSPLKKEWRMKIKMQKFHKMELFLKSQDSILGSSSHGLLQCKKCKSTHTTYSLLQTRCSDEPMTVFAYCYDCSHRWRFC
jgi:DNA-directed RNA polymerase subunit M/transcription elongation factor TFIIS